MRTLTYRCLLFFASVCLCVLPICNPTCEAQDESDSADVAAEVSSEDMEHTEDSADHDSTDHHSEDHGGSGDHGHGPDPTHANMSDTGEDPSEWRSEKAIATLIVFGLLLAGLYAVAWKPISEGLEKRERSIAENIANAEKASQEASAKLEEYEAKLAAATTEAQQIIADAKKDAEASGQRLIAEAQEEANRQRERAVSEIESAKHVALNELADKSTDVAMTLAQRIVGREVRAEDHQGLIQDMLSQLPSKN